MTKPILAVQTEQGRMYVHPVTGERVYSVTNIIDSGIPKKLHLWSARQAAKYAIDNWEYLSGLSSDEERFDLIATAHQRYKEEAAERGDEVHTSAENFLKGNPDGKSLNHMRQLQSFLQTSGFKPVHEEVTVWNRSVGYAGTADLIAYDPKTDSHVLIDFKSGKGVWPEMAVQLEALARGQFIIKPDGTEEEMPYIETVGVLHLRPKSWWWHPVTDMLAADRNWSAFLGAIQISEWKRLHPALVWGTNDRYNESNWPQAA